MSDDQLVTVTIGFKTASGSPYVGYWRMTRSELQRLADDFSQSTHKSIYSGVYNAVNANDATHCKLSLRFTDVLFVG